LKKPFWNFWSTFGYSYDFIAPCLAKSDLLGFGGDFGWCSCNWFNNDKAWGHLAELMAIPVA